MKINSGSQLFNSQPINDDFFVYTKKYKGEIYLQVEKTSELSLFKKIYKAYSDLFGIELRKVSKYCNSDECKNLVEPMVNHNVIYRKYEILNQKIEKINKKRFVKKIDLIEFEKVSLSDHRKETKTSAADKPLNNKGSYTFEFLRSFYSGEGTDISGRTLDEMCQYTHKEKEAKHDYIQWLFPLPEKSQFNASGPVLSEEDFLQLREDPKVIENVRKAYTAMLEFYGFSVNNGQIEKSSDFDEKKNNWFVQNNHNHLRITRIIKSLRLFGLNEEAKAFHDQLVSLTNESPGKVNENSIKFWKEAFTDPKYDLTE